MHTGAFRQGVALLVVFIAFFAARCADANGHDPAPTTPPSEVPGEQTAPPLPTHTPTAPVPTPPTATPVPALVPGDAALNALAVAIQDGDSSLITSKVAPLSVACTAYPGTSSRPPCPKGISAGTKLPVLPVLGCAGSYLEAKALPSQLAGARFVSALSTAPTGNDSRFPVTTRALLFRAPDNTGRAVSVNAEGRIVSLHTGCHEDADQLATSLATGIGFDAFAALQEVLLNLIADSTVDGDYGISVLDLQTGMSIGVGDLDQMPSGCVMNLLVIIETLREVQAGRTDFDEVDAIIRQTIRYSDAQAAYTLYQLVGEGDSDAGVAAVSHLIAELGLEHSSIDHPPAYSEGEAAYFIPNLVTAADMNHALQQLFAGEILDEELTAYLLEAMTNVKPGLNYLTAAISDDATVSHKNGFFWNDGGWVDNDTAIVRFGDDLQYAYAITFLSDEVEELYSEIWMAQDLMRATWEYFSGKYD